jgi:hypothetical protein
MDVYTNAKGKLESEMSLRKRIWIAESVVSEIEPQEAHN